MLAQTVSLFQAVAKSARKMNGLARRLLSSELKKIKWQRKLSVSAAMKKDDDFIIKSFLPEKTIPDMKILDRLWIEDAGFKNLVSVVSFFFKLSILFLWIIKIPTCI